MPASVNAANKLGYEKASLLCLASISAGLANITNAAKNAKGIVSVDGCPMKCSFKTLEKAGFNIDKEIVVRSKVEGQGYVVKYVKNLLLSENYDKYIDINYYFRRLFNLEIYQYVLLENE
jgi:hypothetical protein